MVRRIWNYKEADIDAIAPDFLSACNNQPLVAKLLKLRGIQNADEARAFLNLVDYQPTSGMVFPNMDVAVNRIHEAIAKQEMILVYGDFDVDGITGTSILMQCLKSMGANVSYYIPNRHTEGHGMHAGALCRLVSSRSVKLVITTDTGSTNFNEVSLLNGLGIETIITDHHELSEHLPPAIAVLNPKLLADDSPLAMLSGAGVAFKLCECLGWNDVNSVLDLTAIGTVVDMVPLLRENRYLVWRGIDRINRKKRIGIQAILEEAGAKASAPVNETTFGFVIGPRLNALGRLSDASEAVELLTTDDPERARQLAAKFEQLNRQRKKLVEDGLLEAEKHLQKTGEADDQKAIILASPEWNQGVVGLVATRLIEKYCRPCFIGTVDEESKEVRFSARSIPGFDIHYHLGSLEDLFLRWGGHAGAAGFAIKISDLSTLKSRLFALCKERIRDEQLIPITTVDLKLTTNQINPYLVEMINTMAPFGQDNPMPVFGLEDVIPGARRWMGESEQHLKLILNGSEKGQFLEALYWNAKNIELDEKVNLAFTAEINNFNGANKVQLIIKDIQSASKTKYASKPQPLQVEPITALSPPEAIQKISEGVSRSVDENSVTTAQQTKEKCQWVDHRGRENLDNFLYQILGPTLESPSGSLYRIFCEGTQPHFPIPLHDTFFCTRESQLEANDTSQHLLLWDLPAEPDIFAKLLDIHQPKVVHLIGGKYHKIPLHRTPREFLEGMTQVLRRLGDTQPTFSLLCTKLSTNEAVVMSALTVLNRLGTCNITITPDSLIRVSWSNTASLAQDEWESLLEFRAFTTTLEKVQQYRQWLMTAPLSVIQSGVSQNFHLEREQSYVASH